MASIKKRTGKNGVSYQITVSAGYDSTGRKMIHTKTWAPEKGMTPRQTEKALQRAAADFERSIELGFQLDNRQTFAEYAGYVLGLRAARCERSTGTKNSSCVSIRQSAI